MGAVFHAFHSPGSVHRPHVAHEGTSAKKKGEWGGRRAEFPQDEVGYY